MNTAEIWVLLFSQSTKSESSYCRKTMSFIVLHLEYWWQLVTTTAQKIPPTKPICTVREKKSSFEIINILSRPILRLRLFSTNKRKTSSGNPILQPGCFQSGIVRPIFEFGFSSLFVRFSDFSSACVCAKTKPPKSRLWQKASERERNFRKSATPVVVIIQRLLPTNRVAI